MRNVFSSSMLTGSKRSNPAVNWLDLGNLLILFQVSCPQLDKLREDKQPKCIPVVNGQNRWSYCGATVISDRWLVTAAHCLEGAAQLVVRAGCHNYNRCARIEIASRWIIHPSYNRATINNDIGLVQLRRPLRFGFRIQPACLPGASLPVNTRVIVAGWGRTSNNGQGSSSLKEVTISKLNHWII